MSNTNVRIWFRLSKLFCTTGRDFVNTRLLVHKHVKISVDEWILEATRPHKHVTIFGIFFGQCLYSEQNWKQKFFP